MNNDTLRKLRDMRLPAFADMFKAQIEALGDYENLGFDERLALMVDTKYDARQNNRLKRLVKKASFSDRSAFLGRIEYLPDRHLNRELITTLSTNHYITKGQNVILAGATGCGKTYIANALGMNACQAGYSVRYIRLPELFSELPAARLQGIYPKMMKQYQKIALLILDEFLLIPTSDIEQRDLLELIEYRYGQCATIVCSQFAVEGWHERLGGGALADAIMDRIVPSAYTMVIGGDVSMRRRHQQN